MTIPQYEIDDGTGTFVGTYEECAVQFKDYVYLSQENISELSVGETLSLSETLDLYRIQ